MADDAPLPPRMVTTNPPVVLLEVRAVVAMKLKAACPVCNVTYLIPATADVTLDGLTVIFGDVHLDAQQYVAHAIDAHGLDADEGARILADMR